MTLVMKIDTYEFRLFRKWRKTRKNLNQPISRFRGGRASPFFSESVMLKTVDVVAAVSSERRSASFRVASCRPADDDISDGCAKRSRPNPSNQSTEQHGFDVVWGANLSDSQAWRVGAPSAPTSRLLKPRSESHLWLAVFHSIPQEQG